MDKMLKAVQKDAKISPLKVGVVATIAFLVYEFLWKMSWEQVVASHVDPLNIGILAVVFGGSVIALVVAGKILKVL